MRTETLDQAIEFFGKRYQINKAIEEMAELNAELARYQNDKAMIVNIIEEIADVSIMIEQLKLIFGTELVNCHIGIKMRRLKAIIDEKSKVD